MKRTCLKVTMAALIAILLSACGKEPPKCSDDATISLVKQIIMEQLRNMPGMTDKEILDNLQIELPRATAQDDKIKKYSCQGKLVAGGMYQLPITYESQLDDKNQQIVGVGHIGQGDWMAMYAYVSERVKKTRAEKASTTPQPTAIPEETQEQNTPQPQTPVAKKPQEKDMQFCKELAAKARAAKQGEFAGDPDFLPNVNLCYKLAKEAGEQLVWTTPEPQKQTWKPSFDCSKASTFSEKAVCSDSLLGALDGALSENYKYMLASNIGDGAKNDLRATQKSWLATRNKCSDNQCLVNTYRKRVDEVCEYPVISGVHPVCASSSEIK